MIAGCPCIVGEQHKLENVEVAVLLIEPDDKRPQWTLIYLDHYQVEDQNDQQVNTEDFDDFSDQ